MPRIPYAYASAVIAGVQWRELGWAVSCVKELDRRLEIEEKLYEVFIADFFIYIGMLQPHNQFNY